MRKIEWPLITVRDCRHWNLLQELRFPGIFEKSCNAVAPKGRNIIAWGNALGEERYSLPTEP